MSKVERKEFQERKYMKTISPVRSHSTQNLSQFDSNLDYLLDDLQNSVSRPGSSLAINNDHEYHRSTNGFQSNKTNSLNRVLRVNAANPTTEYSSDDTYSYVTPDGRKHVEGYKKESYSYKTTGGTTDIRPEKVRVQNSINQLDSLLDNLKEVKRTPLVEKDVYGHISRSANIPERKENINSTAVVKRELHYGEPPQTGRSSSLSRRIEKENIVSRDANYTSEEYRGYASSTPPTKTSTLSREMKVKNVRSSPIEVVETTCPEINSEILDHLDPALRPPENTKVTTTIKTYTYEIPGTLDYRNNSDNTVNTKKYIYSPNESNSTPSQSFVYEKVENIENQRSSRPPEVNYETRVFKESTNENYKPYKMPKPPGYDENIIEKVTTTRNYQPGYPRSDNETYVYNETVRTKNIGPGYKTPPPQKKTYIIEETIDERNYIDNPPIRHPPPEKTYIVEKTVNERNYINDYPVRDPPRKETYIYKETHNSVNKNYPDQPRDYLERDTTRVSVKEDNINRTNEPPYRNGYPPAQQQPLNIKYKYTTTSSTTNNFKTGYPPNDEGELLLPRPFPTDERVDGPPKKLDELMNTIGREPPNSPLNAGFQQHERELVNERKVKSLKQQATEVEDLQKREPLPLTKNVKGPPVYYPPGHEMFAKKEEGGGGAWRAQGAYAREGGMYEYESESKSKSKSSSGAAVIPVCLPLCCGLPCTIL